MGKTIELDETKVLEIQQTNIAIIGKAEGAILELQIATDNKLFGPDGQGALQEVERQGKEIARALSWWEKDFIGPVVAAAKELHTMMVSRRDAIADPLREKKERAARAIGAYRAAEEQDRREREEMERKRLQKEEEDKRIAEAADLEKTGAKEEAENLIEQPIFTPPVTYAAPEKTKGVGMRGTWKFEIYNRNLVPDEFWMVDQVTLGGHVRTHKEKAVIPGVRVWFEPSASFSTR